MSTLNELKNKLKFKQESNLEFQSKVLEDNNEVDPNYIFEIEEARYMLNLIANSDFRGKDVQVVYNIALKLQNTLQTIND